MNCQPQKGKSKVADCPDKEAGCAFATCYYAKKAGEKMGKKYNKFGGLTS
jgi:hypothetical protein